MEQNRNNQGYRNIPRGMQEQNRKEQSGRGVPQGNRRPTVQGQHPASRGVPPGRRTRQAPPPQRPQMQRSTSRSGSVELSAGANRNVILVLILLSLILVFAVIVGIQSCGAGETGDSNINDDKIMLSTEKADPSSENPNSGLFAEADENTAVLKAESAYGVLIDLDTNKIVASKKGSERIYPASLTKVMTLIVAYENLPDLSVTYTFDAKMLDYYFEQKASVAGFKAGEAVAAKDLLYGCILPSGADATGALAELVAGSEEAFADLMNEKAEELGLRDTHFVTASGLHDDDHYSTCEDMAAILRYAIKNPEMRKVLATYRYEIAPTEQNPKGITLVSNLKSKMAGDEADGFFVQGGKTGYTPEARHCLATFGANCSEALAESTQPQYILVTAMGQGEYTPIYDAIDIYDKYCK